MQQHVTPAPHRRMIVGISCATGIIYGLRILEVLGRALDLYDLDTGLFNRWSCGPEAATRVAGTRGDA
ncbi:hypothetical protein [Aquabacter spiritensis]|uniref:Uncharacterized protein n=1 Tax=Aquabacter spiritensis TaxID=933073 RepID=A0A4R3LSW6_9HYPH|nr:hypothetical protein [Aquabacter spiritensis]TCT03622.1 hypothetical protein EDC64_109172 [Aquabacter spiritensis]